jgi:hypothetical protein
VIIEIYGGLASVSGRLWPVLRPLLTCSRSRYRPTSAGIQESQYVDRYGAVLRDGRLYFASGLVSRVAARLAGLGYRVGRHEPFRRRPACLLDPQRVEPGGPILSDCDRRLLLAVARSSGQIVIESTSDIPRVVRLLSRFFAGREMALVPGDTAQSARLARLVESHQDLQAAKVDIVSGYRVAQYGPQYWDVVVYCDPRPALSQLARDNLRDTLDRLRPFADDADWRDVIRIRNAMTTPTYGLVPAGMLLDSSQQMQLEAVCGGVIYAPDVCLGYPPVQVLWLKQLIEVVGICLER